MEVHHHSHTARKKWTHYFWEFFMLFLAVTLGFFVENQREHFIEHKRAKQYAKLLKLDLMNDTLRLSEFISSRDSIASVLKHIKNLYEIPTEKMTFRNLHSLKKIEFNMAVFEPQNATYIQLQHSGNLRYFTNTELVLQLAFYDLAVKKFQNLWNEFKTAFGGFNSDHVLKQFIIAEKFITEHPNDTSNKLLKQAGYDFTSWEESQTIKSSIIEGINILNMNVYPSLKNNATAIIDMLDKEYHLK